MPASSLALIRSEICLPRRFLASPPAAYCTCLVHSGIKSHSSKPLRSHLGTNELAKHLFFLRSDSLFYSLSALGAFSSLALTVLSDSAISALSPTQIAALQPVAAQGLRGAQLNAMTSLTLESLAVEFISRTMPSIWAEVTAQTLSKINATAGLTASMIKQISPPSFIHIRADQLLQLTTDTSGTHACRGFTPAQFREIPASSMGGLREACITASNYTVWGNVSADQIAGVGPACAGFRWSHVSMIPIPSYAGFSAECLSKIASQDRRACYTMQEEGIKHIKPPAFAGWTPECWFAALVPLVTPQQVSYLSPDIFTFLDNATISFLNVQAFAGISSEQLAKLNCGTRGRGPGGCQGILNRQIAHLRSASMSGFTSECVQCSTATAWSDIIAEQLAGLRADACAQFSAAQRRSIPDASFAGFRNDCIAQSAPKTWLSITPSQISHLPAEAYAGFSAAHIDTLKWTYAQGGFTADGVHHLNPSACSGFSGMMMSNVRPVALSKITAECLRCTSEVRWRPLMASAHSFHFFQRSEMSRFLISHPRT